MIAIAGIGGTISGEEDVVGCITTIIVLVMFTVLYWLFLGIPYDIIIQPAL